jgi:hypothetical protein
MVLKLYFATNLARVDHFLLKVIWINDFSGLFSGRWSTLQTDHDFSTFFKTKMVKLGCAIIIRDITILPDFSRFPQTVIYLFSRIFGTKKKQKQKKAKIFFKFSTQARIQKKNQKRKLLLAEPFLFLQTSPSKKFLSNPPFFSLSKRFGGEGLFHYFIPTWIPNSSSNFVDFF